MDVNDDHVKVLLLIKSIQVLSHKCSHMLVLDKTCIKLLDDRDVCNRPTQLEDPSIEHQVCKVSMYL